MTQRYDTIIVGQGLAGTTLAWKLMAAGQQVLVVDGEQGTGASSVAAGLMTPVTGKRLVCSPTFHEDWDSAIGFYRQIEQRLEVDLLSIGPIIRVFDRESDRQNYLDRSDRHHSVTSEPWEGKLEVNGPTKVGVKISPAGRLDVERYLTNSRLYFEKQKSYRQGQLGFDGDVQMSDHHYRLVNLSVEAPSLVLCQGAILNERFPKVPNNPAKGEIWKLSLNDATIDSVVHRSIWVAPDNQQPNETVVKNHYTVGATYEWRDFDLSPSAKGEAELGKKLGYLVSEQPLVKRTLVGIRPTMKDREPVLGEHPEFKGLWVFNGLGSKGTLKSPALADRMLGAMTGKRGVPESQSYQRLLPAKSSTHQPLTKLAQQKIEEVLEAGDVAVDATVGRGFDTTYLSRKVGPTGRVVGFDVQKEALDATARRLAAIGAVNVDLIHQGHEAAEEVLKEDRIKAAMFNLGFLPRSDKAVRTTEVTTMAAVAAIYHRMVVGGRMTLLCYRGHEGGPEEYEAIGQWLKEQPGLVADRIESQVTKPTSPVLYVVTKDEERA